MFVFPYAILTPVNAWQGGRRAGGVRESVHVKKHYHGHTVALTFWSTAALATVTVPPGYTAVVSDETVSPGPSGSIFVYGAHW